MESAKRGIFLVIILLLAATAYSANLHLSLENDRLGSNSIFEGFLRFNFTEALPLGTEIIFNSGGTESTISLEEALGSAGVLNNTDISLQAYSSAGKSSNVIVFNNQIKAGFDLRGNIANPRSPGDVIAESAGFKIRASRGPITNPKIFIGNNLVYQYRGNEITWAGLERPHLTNLNPNGLSIGVSSTGVYCQKMNVSASGKYRIKAIVKKNPGTTVGLNVSMIDAGGDITYPLCEDRNPCKEILNNQISSSFAEVNAVLEKDIPQRTEQNVCVFPAAPTEEIGDLFSIRVNEEGTGNGLISGIESDWNFYLYGDYRTYNHILNPGIYADVNLNPEFLDNYMTGAGGCEENCMLIPLNASFESGSEMGLSNLNLEYLLHGTTRAEEREFSLITLLPESARYDGNAVVDLSSLDNVKSPGALGSYSLSASLDGSISNEANFNVVAAPTAFIRYGPFNPGINEEVNFDGTASTAPENRSIASYLWEFGDGNTKTGATATHSYLNQGNYRIKLKVTDSEGINNIDTLIIRVSNVSVGTAEMINETRHSINLFLTNLQGSSQKVIDTADATGLKAELLGFQTELDSLLSEYNRISSNATNATTRLTPIRQRVSEISNMVPLRVSVDTSTFNGGITGPNQIPTCCEFTTEEARSKMFLSQRGINVNAEARIVNIEYPGSQTESFMLVKKDIVGSGAKIYEVLPFGMQIRGVISGGNFSSPTPNVYSFPFTNQLIYTVGSTNLVQALQARTAVLPFDLESVEVAEDAEIVFESECGNNLCEADENAESCPQDCGESNSGFYTAVLAAVLVLAAIVYFGFFFKGGFLKRIFRKGSGRLFKNERDYHAVKGFILNAAQKNVARENIEKALKSKGWKENQINFVFTTIEKEKTPKKR